LCGKYGFRHISGFSLKPTLRLSPVEIKDVFAAPLHPLDLYDPCPYLVPAKTKPVLINTELPL